MWQIIKCLTTKTVHSLIHQACDCADRWQNLKMKRIGEHWEIITGLSEWLESKATRELLWERSQHHRKPGIFCVYMYEWRLWLPKIKTQGRKTVSRHLRRIFFKDIFSQSFHSGLKTHFRTVDLKIKRKNQQEAKPWKGLHTRVGSYTINK